MRIMLSKRGPQNTHHFLSPPRSLCPGNPYVQKCLILGTPHKSCLFIAGPACLLSGIQHTISDGTLKCPEPRDTLSCHPSSCCFSATALYIESNPLALPNTYSQWVPVCSEHPSQARHSWSVPSFSTLQALLLASENLEAEVLGKAVAVTVVQLQQPGQFEPMREKSSKHVNKSFDKTARKML